MLHVGFLAAQVRVSLALIAVGVLALATPPRAALAAASGGEPPATRADGPSEPTEATVSAAAGSTSEAAPPAVTLAVLLPLSGKQQRAAVAVRDGLLAAWLSTPPSTRPRLRILDSEGNAAGAYRSAIADGANAVIGPLLREEVATIATQQITVPTLVLNSLPGGSLPGAAGQPFLYQFALDPEQEARAAAQRISADGHTRGIALFPDSAWGRRIEAAFTAQLQASGTTLLTATQYYDPAAKDFSAPLQAVLGRHAGAATTPAVPATGSDSPQFAFVAATAQTARALKPQLRFQMSYELPLYATSDAWDPSVRAAADMDGLIYPEIPWVLYAGQGAGELWDAVQSTWATESRGRLRLYAFGYDAYHLADGLLGSVRTVGLPGLTGGLEAGSDGRIRRAIEFARIEGGKPQPAGNGVLLPPAPASRAH